MIGELFGYGELKNSVLLVPLSLGFLGSGLKKWGGANVPLLASPHFLK